MVHTRISAETQFPDWWTGKYYITVAYGQSRADNRAEGTDVVLTATSSSLAPDRVLMLNNNGAPGRTFESDFVETDATALIPFVDGRGTLGTHDQQLCPLGQSLGASLWRLDRDDVAGNRTLRRRVFMATGEGGRLISELQKGAAAFVGAHGTYVIYDRQMRKLTRATDIATAYGRGSVVDAMYFLQGEADADAAVLTSKASYKAARATLQADLRSDIAAVTGQTEPIEFITDITPGTPSGTGGAGVGSDVLIAQVELATENSDGHTWCVGPSYYLPFFSREHMSVEGVVCLSEMFARARSILIDGGTPDFLYATGFSLVGSTITITCHVPEPPLVLDSTTIPAATGTSPAGAILVLGFEFTDSSGATITSVSVGTSSIVVTLSREPTGTRRLRYAMNGLGNTDYVDGATGRTDIQTPGSWGNVRDSLAVESQFVPGAYLRNFLAPFDHTF